MAAKKLDLNTATVEELESLVGVGHAKAEAIIEARKAKGGLSSISDLLNISGIGPSLLEQNRGVMVCNPLRSTSAKLNGVTVKRCDRETRSSVGTKPNLEDSSVTDTDLKTDTRRKWRDNSYSGEEEEEEEEEEGEGEGEEEESEEESLSVQEEEEEEEDVGGFIIPGDEESSSAGTDATSTEASTSRERHPSSSEKHWMKRKCNENDQDTKGLSPGKKPCRLGDNTPSDSDAPPEEAPLSPCPSPVAPVSIRKQRLRTLNPPADLGGWLKTFQTWSHTDRLMALDELVETCDATQIRHVMHVIEPQFQRDFISLLPRELALYVLSFLEPKDLLHAAQTCQYWRILAEDTLLWREKCREEGIDDALVFGPKSKRKAVATKSPWKSLYMRQMQIERNWRSNPLRTPKILRGHDDHVITCLEFCGNRIVSGSDDNTLKVWSALTGRCLRTLVGHMGGVWSSQMSDNIIVSGSTDRTLKVWNADTGQCLHTLYGHNSTVRCMHLYNNTVISGSRDATLRMWNITSGQCEHVFMGHVAAVRCVQYDGRRVVSGAYDYMVKVWDPQTETCLHTLQGHTNRVYSLQFDGVHIVSGSLDTSIRVWDVETGNCLHTLIGHQSLTSGMELKDNILVSGNADSTVKVWDITTGQCLQTLQGPNKHQSAVTCLQFNRRFVITSSDDGTVKIWDLRTGEFLRNLVSLRSGGSGGVVWRLRYNNTKLVCAVGSRNGTEETKVMVFDFDVQEALPPPPPPPPPPESL